MAEGFLRSDHRAPVLEDGDLARQLDRLERFAPPTATGWIEAAKR